MVAELFSGAVRGLLGHETLKSDQYGSSLPNVVGFDSVTSQFHLEARPHIFDSTKYALSEVVVSRMDQRLTPSDLKKFVETTTTTRRNPVMDEQGRPYALTRDEALGKIASYQAEKDKECQSDQGRFVSLHKVSSAQKLALSAP